MKTCEPIAGVSPFSAGDRADETVGFFADAPRTTSRAKVDVQKSIRKTFADSGADYLVIDNTSALMHLREMRGRYYTLDGAEHSDLMDWLGNDDPARAAAETVRPVQLGLTERLLQLYDAFIDDCLASFGASRILLIRSHVARFRVSAGTPLSVTNADDATERFLSELDARFARRTGCVVLDALCDWLPESDNWTAPDPAARVLMEAAISEAVRGVVPTRIADWVRPKSPAALIAWYLRREVPVDEEGLAMAFTTATVSPGDLAALAALSASGPENRAIAARCARLVVQDPASRLVSRSVDRAQASLDAVTGSDLNALPLPASYRLEPHIRVDTGQNVVICIRADGSIERVDFEDAESELAAGDSATSLSVRQLLPALNSLEGYLARAERGDSSAFRVTVSSVEELLDSCTWLDWGDILGAENVSVSAPASEVAEARAKTDLAFLFDPDVRLVTVGGGLMDQVQHLSLYANLSAEAGTSYVIDDLRYTWWRSHNGFEADRLAPDLRRRRLTQILPQRLVERFRVVIEETTPQAWLYRQADAWHRLGLRGAVVVTKNEANARKYIASRPAFPVLVYRTHEELQAFITDPPAKFAMFMSQDGIPRTRASSEKISELFDYRHLVDGSVPDRVAEMATKIAERPCAAIHVRRGDYLHAAFDRDGWHGGVSHYREAIENLRAGEYGDQIRNVAVFSDDLAFVREHAHEYGLDLLEGEVFYVEGNRHFDSIYDSYLISRCDVVIGSVGFFSLMSALLADPVPTFVTARPGNVTTLWQE